MGVEVLMGSETGWQVGYLEKKRLEREAGWGSPQNQDCRHH